MTLGTGLQGPHLHLVPDCFAAQVLQLVQVIGTKPTWREEQRRLSARHGRGATTPPPPPSAAACPDPLLPALTPRRQLPHRGFVGAHRDPQAGLGLSGCGRTQGHGVTAKRFGSFPSPCYCLGKPQRAGEELTRGRGGDTGQGPTGDSGAGQEAGHSCPCWQQPRHPHGDMGTW